MQNGRQPLREMVIVLAKNLTASVVLAVSVAALIGSAASAQDVVVDSTGKVVGNVHGSPDSTWVRLKMKDGTWTAIRLGWGQFNRNQGSMPFFVTESVDCKGPQYVWGSLFNYGVSFKKTMNDPKVYFRYPIRPYKSITVAAESYWNTSTGRAECYPVQVPYSTYVGTFKTIDTDILGFKPPFTLK